MDVLTKTTEGRKGTNWDISEQLENWILLMMYAFHAFVNMEKMVRNLQGKRSIGRLLINSEGTKSLKIITRNERRFKMNENFTEKVNSVMIKHGGTVRCKNTDSEGRCTIIQLYQVWKVREISFATELGIFRSTILYGCKT